MTQMAVEMLNPFDMDIDEAFFEKSLNEILIDIGDPNNCKKHTRGTLYQFQNLTALFF